VRQTIDSSGNVGIGVTPSAWWSNSKAMELGGSATSYLAFNASTTSAGGYLYANSFYNGTNNLYKNNGFAAQYAINPGDGSHKWYTAASGTAGATVTFTQVMALNASGSLSIYKATTAAAPAYVVGAMYFDTTLNKLRIGGASGWETVTSV
jgi:hypothetical protein